MKTTWMALELMAAKASHHRISHKAIIIKKKGRHKCPGQKN
jgi:hypothetical protein